MDVFCFTDAIDPVRHEKYGEGEVRVASNSFKKYRKFHRSVCTCKIVCFLFQKNTAFINVSKYDETYG